jgi:N-acetylmuramic acid 6-phosphate etherase
MFTFPPDRSHVLTEHRHPQSMDLDALDTRSLIGLMAEDHQVVVTALINAAGSLARFIDELVPRMKAGGRLIYVGAGTSGRLGVLDASECPPTFQCDPNQVIGIIAGGDAALRKSSEGKEDDRNGASEALCQLKLTRNDTVLGIAAGGTTPFVLGALLIAKSFGAATGLLTCAPPVTSPSACDHLIVLQTGPELLTGSTRLKAGSATKLALNIISTAAFTQLGKVYGNLMVDLNASNSKLLDRALRILIELCPEVNRPRAMELLQAAGGELKLAIVAQKRGISIEDARAILDRVGGSLRAALVNAGTGDHHH